MNTEALRGLAVLSVAYPLAPVRGDTPGGAEQVLLMLDAALVGAGATSVVLACRGSTPAGELVRTEAFTGALSDSARQRARLNHRTAIDTVIASRRIDLVHMHGLDFDRYLPDQGVPVLVTLHLPPSWYSREALFPRRLRTYLHCVSESQRRACPRGVRLLPTIENGVATARLPFVENKKDHAAVLGRICPEKGFHLAIGAAARARRPLLMAGEVFAYEAHERYFQDFVLPRIDGKNCRFLGRIGWDEKCAVISTARCVLIPSLAPETSSLVAMESLACGTPVIAFPAGALAEIVEDGVTGFLVNSEEEMANAIDRAGQIDPRMCRKAAEERFSADRMIRQYFRCYLNLIGK
jgi:glycosyltransferase involved in cell wall biosynthesis